MGFGTSWNLGPGRRAFISLPWWLLPFVLAWALLALLLWLSAAAVYYTGWFVIVVLCWRVPRFLVRASRHAYVSISDRRIQRQLGSSS